MSTVTALKLLYALVRMVDGVHTTVITTKMCLFLALITWKLLVRLCYIK